MEGIAEAYPSHFFAASVRTDARSYVHSEYALTRRPDESQSSQKGWLLKRVSPDFHREQNTLPHRLKRGVPVAWGATRLQSMDRPLYSRK
jgi:hypothetical protein